MKPEGTPPGSAGTIEVEIEKIVYGGEGLGHHEGKVVFVPFTAPGDVIEARPVELKKSYIRAEPMRIVKPGPGRQAPPCPYFGSCGGCQWQHLDYSFQVETKRKILEESFHHRFPASKELPITMHPCPLPYGYRARARLQMRSGAPGPAVGFFRHRSHNVEDVNACPLFRPALNEALTGVRAAHGEGRYGAGEKEIDIACADDGTWACAEKTRANESPADSRNLLTKRVGDLVYVAAAAVFFQANDFMTAELLASVMELVRSGESALDLYAGVGFFTVPLAQRFREVVAVESQRDAHLLCERNAANAGLADVRTVCADVEDWMRATASMAALGFDLILLDPPRSGAGPAVMKGIAEWAPETIVYVSCDQQTLIRDLLILPPADYHIDAIVGFDLFPQTYHFETAVRLRRR